MSLACVQSFDFLYVVQKFLIYKLIWLYIKAKLQKISFKQALNACLPYIPL